MDFDKFNVNLGTIFHCLGLVCVCKISLDAQKQETVKSSTTWGATLEMSQCIFQQSVLLLTRVRLINGDGGLKILKIQSFEVIFIEKMSDNIQFYPNFVKKI